MVHSRSAAKRGPMVLGPQVSLCILVDDYCTALVIKVFGAFFEILLRKWTNYDFGILAAVGKIERHSGSQRLKYCQEGQSLGDRFKLQCRKGVNK